MPKEDIKYSQMYEDDNFIYRHVYLPPDIAPTVPVTHLMTESEWRNLGIQMSTGWMHYMENSSRHHIILFRKRKNNVPVTEA